MLFQHIAVTIFDRPIDSVFVFFSVHINYFKCQRLKKNKNLKSPKAILLYICIHFLHVIFFLSHSFIHLYTFLTRHLLSSPPLISCLAVSTNHSCAYFLKIVNTVLFITIIIFNTSKYCFRFE